ncbi:MAG TPA: complex I NDUFA9 subunit family protein [Phycisphaerales bacterium]|nr:complex I NDUFA9 subunit family protein [Phycisphaerales bacterium]
MSAVGTVAVAGASGFVGRHIVRELLARGREVRALVRSTEKAAGALPVDDRLTIVEGDMFDEAALLRLMAGCVAVVNATGIIREAPGGQTFKRVHVAAVARLVEAAAKARCDRIVHISALGVSEDGRTEYYRSKFEGEQVVRSAGMAWTIFRPSTIHGRDGEFMRMAKGWATGRIAPYVFMPYFARVKKAFPKPVLESPRIQPVFVEDVARAVATSLERDAAVGEVYHLSGGETLTWPELLEFVRDHTPLARKGIRPLPIPGELAAMKARAMTRLGLGALLPFDEGMARMGAADSVAPATKAREHLDFRPAGFRETAAAYISGM